MMLQGTLEDLSSGGILRVASSDGRTGALRFDGIAGCTIYLHEGHLSFAGDDTTDAALAAALVRPGRVTPEGWSAAFADAGDRPAVGESLVRLGHLPADLLASLVLSMIYDPLIALFLAGEGTFEFEPGATHWLGPFRAYPVELIVAEVRRRVREVDEWRPMMPTLDVHVSAPRSLPSTVAEVTLLREEWEVLAAIGSRPLLRELAAEIGRGCYSTARIVHRLHAAELVELSGAALTPRPTGARRAAGRGVVRPAPV